MCEAPGVVEESFGRQPEPHSMTAAELWFLVGKLQPSSASFESEAVIQSAIRNALLAEIRDELRRIGGVIKYLPPNIVRYEPGDPHREPSVVYGGPDV